MVWLALSLVIGFNSLGRQIDGFQQVPIPGQSEVSFTEPGSYVLYYEGVGASEGNVPQFNVSVTPVGGDGTVRLSDYAGSLTYDFSGHSGRALATIDIDKPGKYLLQTESAAANGQANVAVGESVGGDIVRTVVLGLVGTFVLFLAGVAVAVVVAIRRRRARRMLLAADVEKVPGESASPV